MTITNDFVMIIAVLAAVSVFMLVVSIGSLIDYLIKKKNPAHDKNEWIFSPLKRGKKYEVFFKDKSDISIAKSLGVNVREYEEFCKVLDLSPDLSRVIIFRLYSYLSLFVGLLFLLFGQIYIGAFFFLIGTYFLFYPVSQIKSEALKKKMRIKDEFKRFLDLFLAVSKMEMPISDALYLTANGFSFSKQKVEFADEILKTMTYATMNNMQWTDALYEFSKKYNIDSISDFISTICKAQTKGIPVYGQCLSLSKKINTDYYTEKQVASKKAETAILFPILLLKFAPLAVFMIYPIMGGGIF